MQRKFIVRRKSADEFVVCEQCALPIIAAQASNGQSRGIKLPRD